MFMLFEPANFIEYLPRMGEGMLCIAVVMGVLIVITTLLNVLFKKK